MDNVKICEGLSDISDSYSGFLIDQWGTLHDGEKPYDGVLEALDHLKKRGKQIIVISNSGQRADKNIERLVNMGFSKDSFDHVVTSAEMTCRSLKDREDGVFKGWGDKCFLMNRAGDMSILEDTDITVVDTIEDADFILLTGSDAPDKTLENYYDEILKNASRRKLKMICANPEMVITIKDNNILGSGQIARRYEEFGGVVTHIGKPFPSIFHYAKSLFKDLLPSQIVMIGDSLAHDIRGASAMNMDCALVANGVHSGTFSRAKSTADIHKLLKNMGMNYGVLPTCFIPRFAWGKALPDRKNKRRREK
jgi:HAD superfamily hydrolase (TIGR01459 family)